MITGCLQQKNGFYYAVLYLKVNGRRRCKWVPMRLPVEGTSARKAQKAFDEIRLQYEREEEERLDREAKAKELAENTHPDALLPFIEYMEKWLQSTRSSLATATYQSYSIENGIIPKFAGCIQGSEWFKERGQWQDGSFTPEAGHIIFFDWEGDGLTDHVGIVERVENGTVYTVEGNSGDACRQNSYSIGSSVIYGYGIPAY